MSVRVSECLWIYLLVTKGPRTQVMVPECFLMLLFDIPHELGKKSVLDKEGGKESKWHKRMACLYPSFFSVILNMHVVVLEEVTAADLQVNFS